MRHKFLPVTVKEWLKSVLNYRSYPKNKIGYPFFWNTLYYIQYMQWVTNHAHYQAGDNYNDVSLSLHSLRTAIICARVTLSQDRDWDPLSPILTNVRSNFHISATSPKRHTMPQEIRCYSKEIRLQSHKHTNTNCSVTGDGSGPLNDDICGYNPSIRFIPVTPVLEPSRRSLSSVENTFHHFCRGNETGNAQKFTVRPSSFPPESV